MDSDLGVDISQGHFIEPAPPGPAPRLLQPAGWGGRGANKILNAHDHHGGLAAAIHDEALVVLHGKIHDLPKLGSSNVSVDTAGHDFDQCIDESKPDVGCPTPVSIPHARIVWTCRSHRAHIPRVQSLRPTGAANVRAR